MDPISLGTAAQPPPGLVFAYRQPVASRIPAYLLPMSDPVPPPAAAHIATPTGVPPAPLSGVYSTPPPATPLPSYTQQRRPRQGKGGSHEKRRWRDEKIGWIPLTDPCCWRHENQDEHGYSFCCGWCCGCCGGVIIVALSVALVTRTIEFFARLCARPRAETSSRYGVH